MACSMSRQGRVSRCAGPLPKADDAGCVVHAMTPAASVLSSPLHAEEQRRSRREAAEIGPIGRQPAIFTERNRRHINKGLALDLGADRRLRTDIGRRDPVLPPRIQPARRAPSRGLSGQPNQALAPFARRPRWPPGSSELPSPVTKMLQPPLSNGPRLARRVLIVPQSPL